MDIVNFLLHAFLCILWAEIAKRTPKERHPIFATICSCCWALCTILDLVKILTI